MVVVWVGEACGRMRRATRRGCWISPKVAGVEGNGLQLPKEWRVQGLRSFFESIEHAISSFSRYKIAVWICKLIMTEAAMIILSRPLQLHRTYKLTKCIAASAMASCSHLSLTPRYFDK